MKIVYFVLCWFATLFCGLVVSSMVIQDVGFGFLFTGISLLVSIPFIILFCTFMSGVIKKKPTKKQLHATTLGFHSVLSFMTFAVFCAFESSFFSIYFVGIVLGYFAVDSILFHLVIESNYESTSKAESPSLLDSAEIEL